MGFKSDLLLFPRTFEVLAVRSTWHKSRNSARNNKNYRTAIARLIERRENWERERCLWH